MGYILPFVLEYYQPSNLIKMQVLGWWYSIKFTVSNWRLTELAFFMRLLRRAHFLYLKITMRRNFKHCEAEYEYYNMLLCRSQRYERQRCERENQKNCGTTDNRKKRNRVLGRKLRLGRRHTPPSVPYLNNFLFDLQSSVMNISSSVDS